MNDLIKELRQQTGAGMMEIKSALTEAKNDINKAVEILRKKGALKAGKKADRVANEVLDGKFTNKELLLLTLVLFKFTQLVFLFMEPIKLN